MRNGWWWGLAAVVALGVGIVIGSVVVPGRARDRSSQPTQGSPQGGKSSGVNLVPVGEGQKTGPASEFGKEPGDGDDPDWRAFAEAAKVNDSVTMLKAAKELVRRYPDNEWSHVSLGMAYSGLHFWDDAIAAYKQAIKLKPEVSALWYAMGMAYYGAGQHAEAIAAIKQAIKLKPDSVAAWYSLADRYWEAGQGAEAIAVYQQVIKIEPDSAAAWNHLVSSYFLKGRKDEALEALPTLKKLDPAQAAKLEELFMKEK